nr:SdpI family protein [Parvularcula dongshanensis]
MGNFVAKSQPNWFAGLRTPWSLSSRDAWIAGNRALGWGFVASGGLGLVGLLAGGAPLGLGLLLAGSLASTALGTYRSYAVWRAETQR